MLVLQISALLPMWGGFFCTSAGVKPVLLATTDLALLLIMVCSGNASRCSSSTVTACATLQRDKHRQCMKWGIQKHLWMGRGIKFFLKKTHNAHLDSPRITTERMCINAFWGFYGTYSSVYCTNTVIHAHMHSQMRYVSICPHMREGAQSQSTLKQHV